MVVAMFIRNGKTFKIDGEQMAKQLANCPFDNELLKPIYSPEHYTGSFTEYPEDWLPESFKKAKLDSILIFECQTCQKRFISWDNSAIEMEFAEAKIIPDNSYAPREEEAGMTQPIQPQIQESDKECDCGGECDNHDCGNNKASLNNGKFDRPNFYDR